MAAPAAGAYRWKISPARESTPRWSMCRTATATTPARCSAQRSRRWTERIARLAFVIARSACDEAIQIYTGHRMRGGTGLLRYARNDGACGWVSGFAREGARVPECHDPKNKKDQLSLAQ